MATFGEQLAAARQRAGISQHALAKAAGVDASYVNRLERGERQAPEVPLIRRFAAVLGLNATQTDALVVAGNGLPAALERLGPLDPTILLLADVLGDPGIPEDDLVHLRRVIAVLVQRWRPATVAEK
jgi:transcriptional regulator with XRE-family HTH domain